MNPRKLLARTGSLLALLIPACTTDPCLDDGFRQDPPEDCPSQMDMEAESDTQDGSSSTDEETGTEPEPTPPCANGVLDPGEAGVDCGGEACPQNLCADGYTCERDDDCASQTCAPEGRCVSPASCTNDVEDGDETDVDCGGPDCDPCEDGGSCMSGEDCSSGACPDGTCAAPACDDELLNGDETDVDCGGPDCDPCPKE